MWLLRQVIETVLEEQFAKWDYDLSIMFVTKDEITRLNETFLGHAGPTDVITFDYSDLVGTRSTASQTSYKHRMGTRWNASLPGSRVQSAKFPLGEISPQPYPAKRFFGEIVVCVEEALTQARKFDVPWQSEIIRYIVHGLLHLAEYDDRTAKRRAKMKTVENRLMRNLVRRFDVKKLSTH